MSLSLEEDQKLWIVMHSLNGSRRDLVTVQSAALVEGF
jgi:hypothetical protein